VTVREQAFEALYTAHYQAIAGYVLRRVPADEADDVIAQVFTVAWRRLDDVPPAPADRLRLFGVARNSVADQQRSRRRRLHLQARLIWAEAVMLLQDPVSPQVRSATFKVMASLPGVRVLGLMTDPLGRTGYALAPGGQYPNPAPENFNPLQVILIDPRTGAFLATEEIGPMPRSVRCLSFDSKQRCAGSAYIGRSYQDQVDSYVAVVSDGWTDAAPVLPPPSAWSGPIGFPGLPPLP
jgi:hypothetical protein